MSEWLGDLIQSASAAVTLAKDGFSAIEAVRRIGSDRAFDREARDSFLSAIGMSRSGVSTYWVSNDHPTITVMPNYVSPAALESGARIASFAGLHSIGTRAVRALLSPPHAPILHDLVSRIDALPPTRQGLQAVVHINEVSHEDKKQGSLALSLRIHDVVPLYFSEPVLERAREELAAAVPYWIDSLSTPAVSRARRRVGFDLSPPFTPADQKLVNSVAQHQAIDIDDR